MLIVRSKFIGHDGLFLVVAVDTFLGLRWYVGTTLTCTRITVNWCPPLQVIRMFAEKSETALFVTFRNCRCRFGPVRWESGIISVGLTDTQFSNLALRAITRFMHQNVQINFNWLWNKLKQNLCINFEWHFFFCFSKKRTSFWLTWLFNVNIVEFNSGSSVKNRSLVAGYAYDCLHATQLNVQGNSGGKTKYIPAHTYWASVNFLQAPKLFFCGLEILPLLPPKWFLFMCHL